MRYEDWPDREAFEAWVFTLGLGHHSAKELVARCDRPGNGFPPRELWGNIAIPAIWWDMVRREMGRPSSITSSYRDPLYNARKNGDPRSTHMAFGALDGGIVGARPRHVARVARRLRGRYVRVPLDLSRQVDPDRVDMHPLPRWKAPGEDYALMQLKGWVISYTGKAGSFVHIDGRGEDRDIDKG